MGLDGYPVPEILREIIRQCGHDGDQVIGIEIEWNQMMREPAITLNVKPFAPMKATVSPITGRKS